ncbi:hypothetical protein ACET3X_000230 [Alternaria dauci]|uniref:Uncharacterized protein n=1 Tax=Alternaria dauci TaxID=48095 RepID=A0ABR3UUY0_9PLEO
MMVYKGSESFAHVPSDPPKRFDAAARRSSMPSIGGTHSALPDSSATIPTLSSDIVPPGVHTTKKRKLEDTGTDLKHGGQGKEVLPSTEPTNKAPSNWEMAYRQANVAYIKLKGKLAARDAKLLQKDAGIHQLEGQINGLKQVVNQRDQTVNDLQLEIENLKIKTVEMKTYNYCLRHLIANIPAEQRPSVSDHVLFVDKSEAYMSRASS